MQEPDARREAEAFDQFSQYQELEDRFSDVPMQTIVDRVESGVYRAKPARVFRFEEIQEAHRVMEAGEANGKLVVAIAA